MLFLSCSVFLFLFLKADDESAFKSLAEIDWHTLRKRVLHIIRHILAERQKKEISECCHIVENV